MSAICSGSSNNGIILIIRMGALVEPMSTWKLHLLIVEAKGLLFQIFLALLSIWKLTLFVIRLPLNLAGLLPRVRPLSL